ncbi:MAG: 1-acyl-sn-glycerol-3-phosphate acyltransferase [Desulfuromonadaceae bacterium]|nr:1-acyl-sn-glycerol-3-phosphate acyltransferase [Desulfuromonadaceae bacterium]
MAAVSDVVQEKSGGKVTRLFGPSVVVMNLVVYPLLALCTVLGVLLFPLGFVLWKLVTNWDSGRIMRHFIWIYGQGCLFVMKPFVRFRREGFQHLTSGEPCLLVVNHLSFFDTYCMALLPTFDVTFAVRAWPFRMPWYGWFMRLAGYQDVESLDWEEILSSAAATFSKGGHLLFFPEGHRSRTGGLQRFYNGAFRLAAELDVRLVPLCLDGTNKLLPPKRLWFSPAEIVIRALPPVEGKHFAGLEGPRQLRKLVKGQMTEALAQMRGEDPEGLK